MNYVAIDNMRKKKVIINAIYSIITTLITAALSFGIRKIFLTNFGVEYLGYESLFANLFSLISLSDLGFGTVITYALYKEVAQNNEDEIKKLMSTYRLFYRIVGLFVFIIGVLLLPFLDYFVDDIGKYDGKLVFTIYTFNLFLAISTYFLAYKRVLFTVNQREYVCLKIETISNIICSVLKVVIIVVFHSIIGYYLLGIVYNMAANLAIAIRFKKDYKYASETVRLDLAYLKKRNFFSDVKNNFICRLAETIYSGTDSIIIAKMASIAEVGFYTNYIVLDSFVTRILMKLIKPLQAAVGNLIYQEDKNYVKKLFDIGEMIFFHLASFVACGYLLIMQPIITLWLGEDYLLPETCIWAFAILAYIRWNDYYISIFRGAWGDYNIDRNYYICSAVSNILVSILLFHIWGLAGVVLGTAIAHVFLWLGRTTVVMKCIIQDKRVIYYKSQMKYATLFIVELVACMIVNRIEADGVIYIIIRFCMILIIPFVLSFAVYGRTNKYRNATEYLYKFVIETFHRLYVRENKNIDQ